MLKIGLTGGIGSGKSTVAKIFETLGIPVFNADAAAKEIMNNNVDLKLALEQEFGKLVYKNNVLDNKYLANIVFNDNYKLQKLNALVHPPTIKAGLDWEAKQTANYIIKEAALMFEAGSAFGLDYIIGIFSPKHLRISRLIKRDVTTKELVEIRMKNQIDDDIKMKLCDFVIINNEQKLLTTQVIDLHNIILLKTIQ
jgi:dephospho-CoA kinase